VAVPRRIRGWKAGVLVVLAAVGFANVAIALLFANRTYPLTRVYGMDIGGLDRVELIARMEELQHKYKLVVKGPKAAAAYTAAELGLDYTSASSLDSLTSHHWYELPMVRIWDRVPRWNPELDQLMMSGAIDDYARKQKIDAVNAVVEFKDDRFVVKPDQPGGVVEPEAASQAVKRAALEASRSVTVPTKAVEADISGAEAGAAMRAANQILELEYRLQHEGKTFAPSKAVVAGWLSFSPKEDKQALIVSIDKAMISEYVSTVAKDIDVAPVTRVLTLKNGVTTETTAGKNGRAVDREAAVAALAQAAEQRQSAAIELKTAAVAYTTSSTRLPAVGTTGSITYKYCVAVKGVDGSYLEGFAGEVARVYADARGWSLGGKIRFSRVSSGCTFTVWLAAANEVPGFSPSVCSSYYSCRVGANVIINFDRYMGAVSHWTLSLTDYRSMVINHETGHWLGFGHLYCGGPGQAAPVMQQQSMSLQGCAANPWPLTSEKRTVANARGLSYP
jgi:vancomycin resistance protein YoaR